MHRPRLRGVDLDHGVGLLRQPEYPHGVVVEPADQVIDRQPALVHGTEQQCHDRLQPGKARRGGVGGFLGPGVRGVIGGNAVDVG
jgi:hypothetical protein